MERGKLPSKSSLVHGISSSELVRIVEVVVLTKQVRSAKLGAQFSAIQHLYEHGNEDTCDLICLFHFVLG